MGSPRATRSALCRIGLAFGFAAGLAVLPMPVHAEPADDAVPVSEAPAESPSPSPDASTPTDADLPAPPDPDVPASPDPDVPASPDPEVPASPDPEIPASPDPEVPASPDPDVPALPDPPVLPSPVAPSPTRPAAAAIRILPLGDSLTWGVGSSDRAGYRTRLRTALTDAGLKVDLVGSRRSGTGPDTDHEGHPGRRIDEIDARLARWVRAADPDVVLLDIGTNDYVQGYDTAHAPARLARLVDRITVLAPDAHIVVAKLLVIAGDRRAAGVRRLNAAVPRIAAARRARVSVADMSRIPTSNTVDGVHPTDLGYRQMTHQWLQALRPVLATGRSWPRTADPFPMPAITTTAARGAGTLTVTARLTGRLTAVDLGGVTVRLRYRRAGTHTWVGLGTARTDAGGVVRFQRRGTRAGQVAAVVVSGRAAGRLSAAVTVRAT